MKKVILKSTLAVVAVAASCFGAWKTYDTYGSVDNSLLMQNIEALTQNGSNEPGGDPSGENTGATDTKFCCKNVTTKSNKMDITPKCAPGTTYFRKTDHPKTTHNEKCAEAILYPDAKPSDKAWGYCNK